MKRRKRNLMNKLTDKRNLKQNWFLNVIMVFGIIAMMAAVLDLANPSVIYATENVSPVIEAKVETEEEIISIPLDSEETVISDTPVPVSNVIEVGSSNAIISETPPAIEEEYYTAYVCYNGNVNIRKQPNTDSAVIGAVSYGTEVNVTNVNDEWVKVDNGTYLWRNSLSLEKPQPVVDLGTFRVTAYCTCHKCCHPYDPACTGKPSRTRTGTTPTAGRTIAVDPRVIPLGSKVVINGHTYIAEDTGGAIKGDRIDIYMNNHKEAAKFGLQRLNVQIYK